MLPTLHILVVFTAMYQRNTWDQRNTIKNHWNWPNLTMSPHKVTCS